MGMKKIAIFMCILSMATVAQAQDEESSSDSSSSSSTPGGVRVYGGGGLAYLHFLSPEGGLTNDSGMTGKLGVEIPLIGHLSLNIAFGYTSASGTANYDYTDVNLIQYTTPVGYKATMFTGEVGLRDVLIDHNFFRPYIGGGVLLGYFMLKYPDLEPIAVLLGPDFVASESLFDLGFYGEAGLDVRITDMVSVGFNARFAKSKTKTAVTLANNAISYWSAAYSGTLTVKF
jgi:outer membrane protein W